MPPSLPPELLGKIAQMVKEPKQHSPCQQDKMEEEVKAEQATLRALMGSSKTLYEASKKEIHEKCTTGNVCEFLSDAHSGEPYSDIKHLQLFCPSQPPDISYLELFDLGLWDDLGHKLSAKGRNNDGLASASMRYEHSIAFACNQFRDKVVDGGEVLLPKLRSVVLGGLGAMGTKDWNVPEDQSHMPAAVIKRGVPMTLLETTAPTSMCQYDNEGPLSLPGTFIQPSNQLETFTYHPRRSPHAKPNSGDFSLADSVPIVLGATNRLYYETLTVLFPDSFCDCCGDRPLMDFLSLFLGLFHPSRTQVLCLGDIVQCSDLNDVDMGDTKVGIYNYVRLVDDPSRGQAKGTGKSKAKGKQADGKAIGSAPPLSLARLQGVLDRCVHPKWRGRVILKDREDAPPCDSCGLHPEEEFSRRNYGWRALHN